MKKLIILSTIVTIAAISSCKKFVDEKLVTTLTNEYYNTEQGLEDLVKTAYERTRFPFEYEQAYCLWNFGVDEYTVGDQYNFDWYNKYDSRLNPQPAGESYLDDLWNADYDGINRCNLGIERIPNIVGVKSLITEAQKTQRVAELRFLRGYFYFQMVQQFGPIPISTTSSSGIRTEFARRPVPEVYEQIISDLKFAADKLAPTTTEFGRATRGAAQHFLAKAYLTRGSAVNDQRGQKATDMDSAAYYADQVINGGQYVLAPDFKDLWDGVYATHTVPAIGDNGTAPTGDYAKSMAAQKNKEVLFSAQWNQNTTLRGSFGNQSHLYFMMAYDARNADAGIVRDIFNGRPFARLQPTDYAMDIYDRKNDSRFYKQFRTAHYSNVNTSVPNFTAANAPAPALVGKRRFGIGDTAILILMNTPSTTLTAADIDFAAGTRFRYKVYPRYYRDGATVKNGFGYNSASAKGKYLTLIKYNDPFRAALGDAPGVKDGLIARLGETYLIAAEAYGRKGDYTTALARINKLRERASYKLNEVKPPAFWWFEGGTQGDVTSTYPQMIATEAKFDNNDPAEMYPPSATTKQQRFIHFILNERARELMGEMHRWEDLVRTETLIERTRLFNTDAAGIQPYHKLRPIPQREIDLTTIDDKPMTPEQKKAYQNVGY